MKGIINNIGEAATRLGHKAAFKLKKASPELLLIGGIACVIGGTVMACKATKKANDILDEGKEKVDDVRKVLDDETVALTEADEKIIRKDVAKAKLETAGKLVTVYAPAAAVGAAGIAMIFSSHGIMRKRQGALLASYNALDAAFKTYRARVMEEENGKEKDHRYLCGDPREMTVDELNELKFVDQINRAAADMADDSPWYGPYSCRFDATTTFRFSMHPFTNLNVIREVETIMSARLREKGYVCLNEALHELGMDPVPWGQLVGRIYDPHDGGYSDGYDRFEIEAVEEFPDTPGSAITLTFKLDGSIWDRL